MAKPKHRKFNGDKFIDTFEDHPALLRDFARIFSQAYFQEEEAFDLEGFKEFVGEAVATDPTLVEHLYRAYDFSKDTYGHETLCEVIGENGWAVDHDLPLECLAIWLHNQDKCATPATQ